MSSTAGTAAIAQLCLALNVLGASPTAATFPYAVETPLRTAQRVPTKAVGMLPTESALTVGCNDWINSASRETTASEKLIGEMRAWVLLDANWDGEGAVKPSEASLRDAVSFVRLMSAVADELEPMLLASGRSGLFWHGDDLYADLEFLGRGRVAYFIKKNDDKHKGVVAFDSENMPAVFQALLSV